LPAHWPTRDEAQTARLFQPLDVGNLHLSDRTWVPAMVPWRATDEGLVSPQVLAWYARFAKGKPGAIVVEATGIRDVASGPLLRIGDDRFIPGLRELVRCVHEASEGFTRIFIQLIDFLAIKRRPSREKFLSRFVLLDEAQRERLARVDLSLRDADDDTLREALVRMDDDTLREVLSPRDFESMEMGFRERVGDLELPHIRDLPQTLPPLFAAAARRAREAGFDGVELHYAHAYTMASFLSQTNDRTDAYGGSHEGRLRLPLEVYEAVRGAVSRDFVVGARFLGDEVIEGGSRIDHTAAYGVAFARAGMDFLSISKGGRFEDAKQPKVGEAAYPYTGLSGEECMPTVHIKPMRYEGALIDHARPDGNEGPFGRNVPLAHEVRRAVRAAGFGTPIVTAGGISTFEQAEAILAREEADIIGAARQAIADPDWLEKIRAGQGARIRRCLFTNYCEALDQHHKEVTCQRWDREALESVAPAMRSRDGKRRLVAPEDL